MLTGVGRPGSAVGRVGRPTSQRMGVGGLAGFMAAQADGFWYDFGLISSLSQDTAGATPVTAVNDVIGRVVDRRTGANSPRNATQATTSLKPKFQTTGAAFDGSDDNLLTGYQGSSAANFIVAKVTMPASLVSSQVIAGAATSGTDRLFLAVDSSGRVAGGAGNISPGVLSGTTDLRGQTVVVGISASGGVVRLFAATAQELQTTYTGSLTSTVAMRLGAVNTGSASSFFAGSIKSIVAGQEFIDLARFLQIAAAL